MHHAVDPQPRNHFNFHSVWRRYFNWSLRNSHYVQHEYQYYGQCWLSIICGMLSIHDEIMCPNCMHTKLLCNVWAELRGLRTHCSQTPTHLRYRWHKTVSGWIKLNYEPTKTPLYSQWNWSLREACFVSKNMLSMFIVQ